MGRALEDMIQVTTSLHGGVVSDPRYVTYSDVNMRSIVSSGNGRGRDISSSAPVTASR
jgi:hypothetical protein